MNMLKQKQQKQTPDYFGYIFSDFFVFPIIHEVNVSISFKYYFSRTTRILVLSPVLVIIGYGVSVMLLFHLS